MESHGEEKYQKLKNCIGKIKLISVIFQMKKNKKRFHDEFCRNQNLRSILENDPEFLAQIKEAMPETKYYLDWMLKDVDEKF